MLALAWQAVSVSYAQESPTLAVETELRAQPIDRQPPAYPAIPLADGKEGWVVLSYIISPAGEVVEPMIEDSSGSEAFERAALRALEGWKYTPAMRDGLPVEQAMTKTRIVFQLRDKAEGASDDFARRFRRITRLIEEGNLLAAEPFVAELEFGERDNLYEDAWFWWLKYLYLQASNSDDLEEMRKSLQRAVGYEEDYLAPNVFVVAAERLFALNIQLLDLSAAARTFERLRDSKTAQLSKSYEQSMEALRPVYERMQALMAGDQVLVMNARIGEHDYWVHDLLRRSFSIADINGRIDVLDIRCSNGTARYSTLPLDVVLSIPESWGTCGVYLKGEPNTTFAFREYPAHYSSTQVERAGPATPQ